MFLLAKKPGNTVQLIVDDTQPDLNELPADLSMNRAHLIKGKKECIKIDFSPLSSPIFFFLC